MQACMQQVSFIRSLAHVVYILTLCMASEGDLEKNAKLWYEQVDPEVLSVYWGKESPISGTAKYLDRLQDHLRTKKADRDMNEEKELKEIKGKELVAILEELEKKHGWEETDGLQFYTEDKDPGHKSNVLG
jgi:hypothetical protein